MQLQPIGTIRTPFEKLEEMPIQPKGAAGVRGELIIEPAYQAGLRDLEGFSHLYLIYNFHKATRTELVVTPFMDDIPRGVFATRSPLRPSHIGLSITRLVTIQDNIVTIEGIDVLNGTPLLDIKPYIPQFDAATQVTTGWMECCEVDVANARSDRRFT